MSRPAPSHAPRPHSQRDYSRPDSPSAPDGDEDTGSGDDEVGGKGSDRLKQFDYWLEKFDQYRSLLRSCISHATMTPEIPRDPADWLALKADWMRNFTAHAEQPVECPGTSATLLGFKAWAWSHYAQNPMMRDETMGLQVINEVFVRTAVFSSQHTEDSLVRWPTDLEWARYKTLVSEMMVHHFRKPTTDALYEKLQTFKPRTVSPAELEDEFVERKMPEGLRIELELLRKKAEKDIARGKADVKVDVSEEASGALWREAPEEICANLPFRVARLICKVDFDEALLLQFPPWPEAEVQFTPSTYTRAKRWLVQKCTIEQPEDVTALFRELANTMFWPLGSDTEKYRSRITASNLNTSLDILSNEIGANLAQYLHDRMLKPLDELLRQTSGVAPMFWDAIFLAIFEFDIIQRLNFKWLDDYFIVNPHEEKSRRRMNSRRFKGVLDQRPYVVSACRQKWILFRRRLIPCRTSTVHSVLHVLHLVDTQFRNQDDEATLEDGHDMSCIIETFLPRGVKCVT